MKKKSSHKVSHAAVHHPLATDNVSQRLDEIIDAWNIQPLQDFLANPASTQEMQDLGKKLFFQEFSPIGQLILNGALEITFTNPAARAILAMGTRGLDIYPHPFTDYILASDKEAVDEFFLYLQQHPHHLQSLVARKSEVLSYPKVPRGHLKLTGRYFPTTNNYYFFVTDITHDLQFNGQLQWSRHLLQEIFDSGPEIMFTTTNGEDVLNANKRFYQFFGEIGIVPGQVAEQSILTISDYFISESHEPYLRRSYEQVPWPVYICQHPDEQHIAKVRSKLTNHDQLYYFRVKVFHLTNFSDQDLFLVMFTDITEQLAHEKQLEQKIAEALVQHREKDLLLIQQAKMATLGEMMAAIAHQWRQPLNVLSLSLEILALDLEDCQIENTHLSNRLHEHLSLSHNQINYLTQTIEDFKNFFRKEQHKIHFSLLSAIDTTLKLATPMLQKNHIQCVVEHQNLRPQLSIESPLVEEQLEIRQVKIYGVSSQLQQVLISLISNATDALCATREQQNGGDECRPNIAISTFYHNRLATIKIFNPSKPLPPETLARIGELYFTTKGQGKGTGLGFYLSRLIIKEHFQGDLYIANVQNGVEVTITIPAGH